MNARLEREQLQAHAARDQAAREALSLELARQRGAAAPGARPTLTLSPLVKRAAQPPEPTVGKQPDNQSIQLRLLLPPGAEPQSARYTIVVRTWTGGDAVWSRGGLTPSTADGKRVVTAFIAGDVFAPGPYEITLTRNASDTRTEVAAYEVAIRPDR